MKPDCVRLALQKSGRLYEQSIALLKRCNIDIYHNYRQLLARTNEINLEILFLRDDDIPHFVADGICDLGIVGENIFREECLIWEQHSPNREFPAKLHTRLQFSHCRLSLSVPESFSYSLNSLRNRKIATSYPATLQDFLDRNGCNAQVIKMEGSVELAPKLQIADLICDLISTGATLEANGLVEAETILESEAILIQSTAFQPVSEAKQNTLNQLFTRLRGILQAMHSKYIMLNAPKTQINAICKLLPGAGSPTVIPLLDPTQVAIHAVSGEPRIWELMESLKKAGAYSILIQPVEVILP